MDVTPTRPKVFLLAEQDRNLVANGPALVDPSGARHDIPPKVHEAMAYVEAALREGYAVQITPLRQELPIDEAADAALMPRKELRLLVSQGEIPFRSSDYVDWVQLSDVLALSARLDAARDEMLQSFAEEESWDDPQDGDR
ncbi:hypothetical protein [Kribbella sp. NPDC051620]|uniref:hypothetical protein n=1 Tax=Kribbella sp. NPDC051620 TaxID=3364120 RepID=UPI0037B11289